MSVKQRRQREKENLRQLILDTAREMFAEEGYHSVSMRKIADKIEYSPTTIYLYFKDKNDLLQQICNETFANLGQKLQSISKKHTTNIDGLREGLRTYIEFGLKHPKHYEVTFMLPLTENLGDEFEGSLGKRAFEFLKIGVKDCMESGEIARGDVDLVSQTLWAGIHGVTSLLIGHEGFPFVNKKTLINSVIDTMLKGLTAKDEPK
ncbi:MAG TPA: TetR/AcrR family transcriptional regulator [Pyrinomonadaceae bacterium]|nr:TetR/AcrR family transcriptional regulator [Pyrinomonadaceae bacterium]